MDLLAHLNPPQRQAVDHAEGPLLILAGAGSGKTRVITHRIARLIEQGHARPSQIVAMTFTNKAAQEMRERVDELLHQMRLDAASSDVTISTFHSLGARLLRRHADRLGLNWSFQIYDELDQYKVVRELMSARDMETDASNIRNMLGYIERMKNRAWTPKQAHEHAFRRDDEDRAWFYESYQEALRQSNCLDFGDLILGIIEMFRDDPSLAASYSRQWRFVMVDEFQDTNPAQYELLGHLTSEHNNLAVVGDDDQAIYRWRGATIANIMGFEKDYPGATIIKLEQNYRSTQVILDAADDVIRHNPDRRDKKLWTESEGGSPITVFTGRDEREEAQFVADKIRLLSSRQERTNWDEFAVFFRTNAQARAFEEQLRFASVPYQIVGGTSFYQREEIKDLLAYLKVALNPENHVDALRVINKPARGIGDKSVARFIAASQVPGLDTLFGVMRFVLGEDMTFEGDLHLMEPAPSDSNQDQALLEIESLRAQQLEGIRDFYDIIQSLRDDLAHVESLSRILREFIERLHYFDYIRDKHPEVAEDKARNVGELVNAIEEFERDFEEGRVGADEGTFLQQDLIEDSTSVLADGVAVRKLRAFLDQSALVRAESNSDEEQSLLKEGRVTLMTVHGSKGLEFDTVFMSGMEDEVFPSIRDPNDAEELEEERRLAYVAITRAKQHLYITNAKRRRVYGQLKDSSPSRFLMDLDPDRIAIDPKSSSKKLDWRPSYQQSARRAAPLTDEQRYFSDGQAADASFSFDQTVDPEAALALQEQAHFSQIADWDLDADPDEIVGDDDDPLVGKTVTHTRFGIGRVMAVSGQGDKAVVKINFPSGGEQKVVRKFLKILG